MRAVGLILIFVSIPVFFALLKGKQSHRNALYFLIGVLPFTQTFLNLDASFVAFAADGYAKGFTLSILDGLALAIVATARKPFGNLPFNLVFLFYIFAASLSVLQANGMLISAAYVFQLIRVFILFVAVAVVAQTPGALRYIAYGLATAAIIQAGMSVYQRATGTFQATGTVSHQNLLGMMLHFVTLPLLAMLLAGDKSKLLMAGVASGVFTVALGASRGSMLFLAIGIALLFVFSLRRRRTPHKFKMVGFAVLVALAASPIVSDSIERRYETMAQNDTGYDEREAFERAAKMMIADNPMGVGASRYVQEANIGGYSSRAGVIWAWGSRSANVHHMYLLTAAELGYLGLLAIVALMIAPIWRGLKYSFADKMAARGDLVLGSTVAIIALALHNFYEWVMVLDSTQYMIAISLGTIAGSIKQREAQQRYARRQSMLAARKAAAEERYRPALSMQPKKT